MFCDGSFSCSNANYIKLSNDDTWIWCQALSSCSNTKHIESYGPLHSCYSELSCSNTLFEFNYSFSGIDCSSAHSCANTILINPHVIYSRGILSLYNSTIYKFGNISELNLYLYGSYSGYLATVICNNHATCTIHCYGNSCNNITLICDNTANCIINCDYSEFNHLCPNGLKLGNIDNTVDSYLLSNLDIFGYWTDIDNAEYICNTSLTNAINCNQRLIELS